MQHHMRAVGSAHIIKKMLRSYGTLQAMLITFQRTKVRCYNIHRSYGTFWSSRLEDTLIALLAEASSFAILFLISLSMTNAIYLTTTEPFSGKSIIALGLMNFLMGKSVDLGVFAVESAPMDKPLSGAQSKVLTWMAFAPPVPNGMVVKIIFLLVIYQLRIIKIYLWTKCIIWRTGFLYSQKNFIWKEDTVVATAVGIVLMRRQTNKRSKTLSERNWLLFRINENKFSKE